MADYIAERAYVKYARVKEDSEECGGALRQLFACVEEFKKQQTEFEVDSIEHIVTLQLLLLYETRPTIIVPDERTRAAVEGSMAAFLAKEGIPPLPILIRAPAPAPDAAAPAPLPPPPAPAPAPAPALEPQAGKGKGKSSTSTSHASSSTNSNKRNQEDCDSSSSQKRRRL